MSCAIGPTTSGSCGCFRARIRRPGPRSRVISIFKSICFPVPSRAAAEIAIAGAGPAGLAVAMGAAAPAAAGAVGRAAVLAAAVGPEAAGREVVGRAAAGWAAVGPEAAVATEDDRSAIGGRGLGQERGGEAPTIRPSGRAGWSHARPEARRRAAATGGRVAAGRDGRGRVAAQVAVQDDRDRAAARVAVRADRGRAVALAAVARGGRDRPADQAAADQAAVGQAAVGQARGVQSSSTEDRADLAGQVVARAVAAGRDSDQVAVRDTMARSATPRAGRSPSPSRPTRSSGPRPGARTL